MVGVAGWLLMFFMIALLLLCRAAILSSIAFFELFVSLSLTLPSLYGVWQVFLWCGMGVGGFGRSGVCIGVWEGRGGEGCGGSFVVLFILDTALDQRD